MSLIQDADIPSPHWASDDLREAAEAARQIFRTAVALIREARKTRSDHASNERLVGLGRELITLCSKSRDPIQPVAEELIAVRKKMLSPLPALDGISDSFAIGLASSFGQHVLDNGYALPLKGDDPRGRRLCVNPNDTKSLGKMRCQLKQFKTPDIDAMYRLISEEMGAATLRRSELHFGRREGATPLSEASTNAPKKDNKDLSPQVEPKPVTGGADSGCTEVAEELQQLEASTPTFVKGDGQWVKNKIAAQLQDIETNTLRRYRYTGIRTTDGMLGRDKDGRVWRHVGNQHSHPWYLRTSLLRVHAQTGQNRR